MKLPGKAQCRSDYDRAHLGREKLLLALIILHLSEYSMLLIEFGSSAVIHSIGMPADTILARDAPYYNEANHNHSTLRQQVIESHHLIFIYRNEESSHRNMYTYLPNNSSILNRPLSITTLPFESSQPIQYKSVQQQLQAPY